MLKTRVLSFLGAAILFSLCMSSVASVASPTCWFLRSQEPGAPSVVIPEGLKTLSTAGYFKVHYSPSERLFQDANRNGTPDILEEKVDVMERSHHFLQTELGWKLPATRWDMNRPVLDAYFVPAPENFLATTRSSEKPYLVFNAAVLLSRNFAAVWIHQLAHAAELQYKTGGEYWFYEATAGWMEGQFQAYSKPAQISQVERLTHPEISLTEPSPLYALGASAFVDLLSRPYRDVIRQIWEQWSSSKEETVMEIIKRVLALNHLPDLDSYAQNYFLLSAAEASIKDHQIVSLKPYSAMVFQGMPERSSGGEQISFLPANGGPYSASLVFFAKGQQGGTLAVKKDLRETWFAQVPYSGMDHYKLVLVNSSGSELRGVLQQNYDSTIPAVMEYFRVNAEDSFVQLEWKTTQENGVAFWNLYRVQNGKKERLNSYAIPATIHSEQGIHYIFVNSSTADFYSLEAITSEGFPSPLAGAGKAP